MQDLENQLHMRMAILRCLKLLSATANTDNFERPPYPYTHGSLLAQGCDMCMPSSPTLFLAEPLQVVIIYFDVYLLRRAYCTATGASLGISSNNELACVINYPIAVGMK
eukprot:6204100-Pleurochrysis_carterae.AAC.3